jgi:hypothetical protein
MTVFDFKKFRLDPDPASAKYLEPNPDSVNTDPIIRFSKN